ncbi:hypothetical protein DOTSEDRAFT_34871 [Dothistroma septosporum NZE10]|uniref:Uncharacterized protein n=1 Tax=Dothistroma septosporum (strain NZE10 / CBS 128990) TaxID=675120 RepID=N1PLQ9_DOTSN|nr:hypothetical protein DOTSEDRAFT_34871 [Dothistroma septosporum NZE10]
MTISRTAYGLRGIFKLPAELRLNIYGQAISNFDPIHLQRLRDEARIKQEAAAVEVLDFFRKARASGFQYDYEEFEKLHGMHESWLKRYERLEEIVAEENSTAPLERGIVQRLHIPSQNPPIGSFTILSSLSHSHPSHPQHQRRPQHPHNTRAVVTNTTRTKPFRILDLPIELHLESYENTTKSFDPPAAQTAGSKDFRLPLLNTCQTILDEALSPNLDHIRSLGKEAKTK